MGGGREGGRNTRNGRGKRSKANVSARATQAPCPVALGFFAEASEGHRLGSPLDRPAGCSLRARAPSTTAKSTRLPGVPAHTHKPNQTFDRRIDGPDRAAISVPLPRGSDVRRSRWGLRWNRAELSRFEAALARRSSAALASPPPILGEWMAGPDGWLCVCVRACVCARALLHPRLLSAEPGRARVSDGGSRPRRSPPSRDSPSRPGLLEGWGRACLRGHGPGPSLRPGAPSSSRGPDRAAEYHGRFQRAGACGPDLRPERREREREGWTQRRGERGRDGKVGGG